MKLNSKTCTRLGLAITIALLGACASTPKGPSPELMRLQGEVERLRSDTRIAPYADDELQRADQAVESIVRNERKLERDDYNHRLYLADRLVQVAEAEGLGRYAEARGLELGRERDQLVAEARAAQLRQARGETVIAERNADRALTLADQERHNASLARSMAQREHEAANRSDAIAESERRGASVARDEARSAGHEADKARLEAAEAAGRTEDARELAANAQAGEADARSQAEIDRADARQQRQLASNAQSQTAQARLETARANAGQAAAEDELDALRAQLSELKTQTTERGLVVTLGDVLFELDRAELKAGGKRTLDQLATALLSDDSVQLAVEGHTDSTGSRQHNLDLSNRRASTVSDYLMSKGVADARIQSIGLGPDFPVASNGSEAGRQQNRRVEVILKSPVARVSQAD